MKRAVTRIAAVVLAAGALAACRTAPVYNVQETPLTVSSDVTTEQVGEAIKRAGAGLGWIVREEAPGHDIGTLMLRSHVAVVDIVYDTDSFSIGYKDSTNLRYDGSVIHQNYNGWIQNLEQAIRAQAAAL